MRLEPIVARSRYLKRRLTETNDVALNLPAQITAEAFAVVACFCYGSDIAITPFNVITLRVAAELLEMTDDGGGSEENVNLRGKTESYFCQAVAVSREYASVMLRSCVELLPEAEEMAFLASRCIEALVSNDGFSDGVSDSWMGDLNELAAEEFLMIADSMKGRLAGDHDILYRAVDMYLKEHTGSLTEEQKIRICAVVDCDKLSQHLLMRAVQNPIMPLRFVIRAMLVEQLNTRRSVYSAAACAPQTQAHTHKLHSDCITLGTILHRDAAVRHIAQLKASMEATSERIVSLEHDLTQMRKQLQESEKRRAMLESTRSASFRFSWEDRREKREKRMPLPNPRNSKSLSKILIAGLRNMFHASKTDSEHGSSIEGRDDEWPPPRHKKHSFA
ncbi:hypothetical protein ACLOJK_035976 [Asimina triloba]